MSNQTDTTRIYVAEEKINGHELRLDKHDFRLDRLEESIPLLSRLEAILEAQVELNKTQSLQLNQVSQQSERTFQAINDNLTKLNIVTDRLKEDFDKSTKQSEMKIDEINTKVDSSLEKRKIDTTDWGVRIFYWLVLAISGTVFAWAMSQAGLG